MLDITITGERVGLCDDPWWLYQAYTEAEHDGDEELAAEYYVALSKGSKITLLKQPKTSCTEGRLRMPRGSLKVKDGVQGTCFDEVWRLLVAPPEMRAAIRSLACIGMR